MFVLSAFVIVDGHERIGFNVGRFYFVVHRLSQHALLFVLSNRLLLVESRPSRPRNTQKYPWFLLMSSFDDQVIIWIGLSLKANNVKTS